MSNASCENIKFCDVCKTPLEINKKTVYVVSVENRFFHYVDNWNAVDCPHCGCQNLLKNRYEKETERKERLLERLMMLGKSNCEESEETDNE